jgi:sucrose-6F-phosphate phosphohydrolase
MGRNSTAAAFDIRGAPKQDADGTTFYNSTDRILNCRRVVMERLNLIIRDLDGTLLGDEHALEEFAAWYRVARPQFRLVYSSGRFVDSVLASIASTLLPVPDAIIGGVGTQIYDMETSRIMSTWPPSVIEWNPYIVQTIGESFSELRLQPQRLLSRHKVSFYGSDLDQHFLARMKFHLARAGQQVTVVYSSNRELDILPESSSKGAAASYLVQKWRIAHEHVIVSGDSGNDAEMFRVGFRGVVVGNATPELKSFVAPHVYHASSEFAAGVLEGIEFWTSQPRDDKRHITRNSFTADG